MAAQEYTVPGGATYGRIATAIGYRPIAVAGICIYGLAAVQDIHVCDTRCQLIRGITILCMRDLFLLEYTVLYGPSDMSVTLCRTHESAIGCHAAHAFEHVRMYEH